MVAGIFLVAVLCAQLTGPLVFLAFRLALWAIRLVLIGLALALALPLLVLQALLNAALEVRRRSAIEPRRGP
jgi:hypothetical protein